MAVGNLPQNSKNAAFRKMLLAGAQSREKRNASDTKGTLNQDDKNQLKKRGLPAKKPGLFQKVADTDADGN